MALKETQKHFYALDLNYDHFSTNPDDSANLLKLRLKQAEQDQSLRHVASTYDLHNHVVRDTFTGEGKKLVTFANMLKHGTFPLAKILQEVLSLGEKEMGNPIEIEFAVDLHVASGKRIAFNLLQIRPIALREESVEIDMKNINLDNTLIVSQHALGNGVTDGIRDLVYVKPQKFDAARNEETVGMIDALNKQFLEEGNNYILVGPGRWGSSDPWLGIPVKWPQISAARLIVEAGIDNYRIDPSQGTHFFQNLTSFRVGYFTINPFINEGRYDLEFLDSQTAVFENDVLRHVRFDDPLIIKIDGKHNRGLVIKPKPKEHQE